MEESKRLTDFDKTRKIIESCKSLAQFQAADNMIENFKQKYGINIYSKDLDTLWLSLLNKLEE